MNLVQVDSLGRPLGSARRVRKPAPTPPVAVKPTPAQLGAATLKRQAGDRRAALQDRLRVAVEAAAGGRVFVNDVKPSAAERGPLTAWARSVPQWETGNGFSPGKMEMGRPSVWVRVKGGGA